MPDDPSLTCPLACPQVRDSSWRTSGVQMGAATKASRDQQGTSQQGSIQQGGDKPLLRTATDRTNWLVTELQAHYKKACVDSRVAAGGVPEQVGLRRTCLCQGAVLLRESRGNGNMRGPRDTVNMRGSRGDALSPACHQVLRGLVQGE